MTNFTRYAILVVVQGQYSGWHSIGTGLTKNVQEAHLFNRRDLAEKRLETYLKQPRSYTSAEIVEFTVTMAQK